ncbi:MAG: hypothetical protein AAGJ93_03525 [Bacteroidota bacterium]
MQPPPGSALQKLKRLIDALTNEKQSEPQPLQAVGKLLQQMSDLKDGQSNDGP